MVSPRNLALLSKVSNAKSDSNLDSYAVDSLEFHWRTLVPLELELYLSSAGVPLENLRSAGAPGDAPGHCQAVPQPGACPGHQTHG